MGSLPFEYSDVSHRHVHDNFITLPNRTDKLDEFLCGKVNRKHFLCGMCLDNHSVAINSRTFDCVPCNTTTSAAKLAGHLIGYILLTFIPITVLFPVITFFNVNLASSAAAGFVLYAQVISGESFDVNPDAYTGQYNTIQNVYRTIYGILNLESFAFVIKGFCVSSHLTTLQVLCIEYAIASYPLVVILLIYMWYKLKSRCKSDPKQSAVEPELPSSTSTHSIFSGSRKPAIKIKVNLVRAYAAFLMLSYTKFFLAAIKTVIPSNVFAANGTFLFNRVFFAGHLSFSDSEYLFPYGILAIFILVVVVPLPPLLLLGPLQFVDWLADKPKFRFLQKYWPSIMIHTFLDTLQGYKPRRRYFAGLYFIFRVVMNLAFMLSPDIPTQLAIQHIVTSIFAVLVPVLRPYTSNLHNCMDALLFLNLNILNTLTLYTYGRTHSTTILVIKCILVFLPMVYMICYCIWSKCHKAMTKNIALRYHSVRPLSNMVKDESNTEESEKLLKKEDDPFEESVDYSSDDPDEEIFHRARKGNRFKSATVKTHLPRRPGEVTRTSIIIHNPELLNYKSEEGENDFKAESDSGIGRQSDSGRGDTNDSVS